MPVSGGAEMVARLVERHETATTQTTRRPVAFASPKSATTFFLVHAGLAASFNRFLCCELTGRRPLALPGRIVLPSFLNVGPPAL